MGDSSKPLYLRSYSVAPYNAFFILNTFAKKGREIRKKKKRKEGKEEKENGRMMDRRKEGRRERMTK